MGRGAGLRRAAVAAVGVGLALQLVPPGSRYTLLHPGARLDEGEAQVLVDALELMVEAD